MQDPGPGIFTWDLGPGTLHLEPFTWNMGPRAWDPICGTLYGTGTKYHYVESGTHTLIQT